MKKITANFKLKKDEHIYYNPDNSGKIESLYFEDAEGYQEEIRVSKVILDYLNLVRDYGLSEGEKVYKDKVKKILGL
jgi:hypothetical protein